MAPSSDSITLGLFVHGVNYSKPADELRPTELYQMENVEIGNAGQADKRSGSTPYNATALNSGATVTACGNQRFSSASNKDFAIVGDKFYEDPGGTPLDRTSTATITAGDDNTWQTVKAGGTLIGHNGVSGDTIIKWAASGNIAALDVDSRFTTAEWVEWWDRRAWWANLSSGPNYIWYSDSDDIETYGATSYKIADGDVTGIKRMMNGIIVHTPDSIAMLVPTGDASTPYRKVDIILASDGLGGTVAGRSVVNIPGIGQAFLRNDGIWVLDGSQNINKISGKLDGSRFWDLLNVDRFPYSFAQVYPSKSQVLWWLPYGTTQTKMNVAIVLDYKLTLQTGEYVWYGPYVDLTRNCSALIGNSLYFGGFDGFVYQHDTGTADNDGTTDIAIDAHFETAMPPPYGGAVDVRWEKVRHFYEVKGNWELQVQELSPDVAGPGRTLKMGESYGAIGTTFTIGVSKIAGETEIEYADRPLSGASPFKRLWFRNSNADETFSIRKSILTFTPLGTIPRDISGAH